MLGEAQFGDFAGPFGGGPMLDSGNHSPHDCKREDTHTNEDRPNQFPAFTGMQIMTSEDATAATQAAAEALADVFIEMGFVCHFSGANSSPNPARLFWPAVIGLKDQIFVIKDPPPPVPLRALL
jgi:hypothetical protein